MAYSPEVARPNEHRNPPQVSEVAPADDIRTIMLNQVSWGAVFAGATIGLVMQIILNMVGVGVGLSTVDVAAGDTPSARSLSVGAGIWWVISGIVAAAVGGYIAGRLSGKASQSTTAYHGLIAWAVSTLAVVYLLSSAASGLIGGTVSTASSALGGAGKAIGGSVQTAVQTAAPSLEYERSNGYHREQGSQHLGRPGSCSASRRRSNSCSCGALGRPRSKGCCNRQSC